MGNCDTSEAAQRVYYRRLAEMTPSERLGVGCALWEAGNALRRAAVKQMYPDASEDEITDRVAVARHGDALANAAYGRC